MIILIDTTEEKLGQEVFDRLKEKKENIENYEYVDTSKMDISNCLGCNYCWLKTPGECVVRDDYEPLLKKMSGSDQVWLISDTRFGFVTYKTKNIVDRFMPLVTMYIHFVKKQMRHVPRYKKNTDWGIIYTGEGDKEYLSRWGERVAINFAARSLGVYSFDQIEEAVTCM